MTTTLVRFNTMFGIREFNIYSEQCINNNNSLYRYAEVHGNTWRITFTDELDDQPRAFTPGIMGMNHRGMYRYDDEQDMYIQM